MPRSTGTRAAVRARLTVCWVVVSSPLGSRRLGVATHSPGPAVGHVGKGGTALALTDPDDLVWAGGGQVVCGSAQGGREPQRPAVRVRDDLRVRTMTLVLGRIVRASVADPVALDERAVQEQARRLVREVFDDSGDAGVGGVDRNAETRSQLSQEACRCRYVRASTACADGRTCGADHPPG
jgi:hypothetical protein